MSIFPKKQRRSEFPDEFKMVKRATLRLAEEEPMFNGKAVSEIEVVWSSHCFVSAASPKEFISKGSEFWPFKSMFKRPGL